MPGTTSSGELLWVPFNTTIELVGDIGVGCPVLYQAEVVGKRSLLHPVSRVSPPSPPDAGEGGKLPIA